MPVLAAVALRDPEGARSAVERMLAASPHRGTVTRIHVHGHAAIGVATRDGTDDASVAVDARGGAAFCGRLDNVIELAAALRLSQHAAGASPAGVVLAAHRAWGPHAAARMRGVFAGVVADGDELVAFRDHLGYRALFYRSDPAGAFLASEPKQVVAGARIPYEPDLDVVERVFWDDYSDDTPTAIRGVSRLPKASVLHAAPDRARRSTYWHPEALLEAGSVDRADIAERFDVLMDQAVSRTLTGCDAISLSGGVDSPAVAAYAAGAHRRATGQPLLAITQVYPRLPAVDERRYVEAVVGHLGMPLLTYEHDADHFGSLDRWMRLFDGPPTVWSGTEMDELYRQALSHGRRTILTGEVAEFLTEMSRHLSAHLLLHGRLGAFAERTRLQRAGGMRARRIARNLATTLMPRPAAVALWRRRLVYSAAPVPPWLDGRCLRRVPGFLERRPRDRWRYEQLRAFIGPGLSVEAEEVRQDVLGVTVRAPFADVDLWEFFLGLRAEDKEPRPGSKSLMRELLRGRVPDVILDRTDKTVFNETFLANIDYASLRDRLGHDDGIRISGVDYSLLREHLAREDLDLVGYIWARDLAVVHAFLGIWAEPASKEGAA